MAMSSNPIRTLQLAAEYYGILSHLAERSESVGLVELRSLHQKYHPDDARSPERVAGLLEEFDLLEKAADSDLAWEVPHLVGEFLRHLSMRQRLAAPGQLAPIIDEISRLTEDLRQAVSMGDLDAVRLASANIRQALDAARSLSLNNYRAIIHEVMRIKSRQDNRSLRERFLFISQLHERHLTPLGALVDVGGEMESRAIELIAVARAARESLANDPFVPEIATKIIASVRRMKDEAWVSFHSALREVTPLFRQIRRDHALAASVSSVLDAFGRLGPKALEGIADQLAISRWRADNIFSGYAVEDYLVGVTRHVAQPDRGPVLTTDDEMPAARLLDANTVASALTNDGEQPDLIRWLLNRYSEYPDQQILQAFLAIAEDPGFSTEPGEGLATAETTEAVYTYHPARIRAHA